MPTKCQQKASITLQTEHKLFSPFYFMYTEAHMQRIID